MRISFKNIRKIAALICVEILLAGIVIYTITSSFSTQESFMIKNAEVDSMYENWLILRTSVLSYLSAPTTSRRFEREKLISDFEEFDFSMMQISDEITFSKILSPD